ncbi:MAG TPA: hypothetical protein VIU33_09670 [Nitrospiria bacterium]
MGNVSSDTVAINVMDPFDVEALLRHRWEGMKIALEAGNIETALVYFSPGAREKFQYVFETLAPDLPEVAASLQPLRLVGVRDFIAECFTNRLEEGEFNAYFVYFTRDSSGLWKLTAM